MSEILTDNIWSHIKRLSRKPGRKSAAIAYVSTSNYVRFGDGDVLVCDASVSAIKSGETSAAVLAQFHKAGAQIFSCPGLHAKTLVLGRSVLVGSCNLSESSANVLRECAILSSDTTLRSQTLAFIHGLAKQSEPVDDAFIVRILRMRVSKRRGKAPRKRKTLRFGKRTWVISTVLLDEDRYQDEAPLVAEAEKGVKRKLHKTRAEIANVRWTGKDRFRRLAREGDTLIELNASGKRVTVSSPVAILQRQDHGHWTRFYYEPPDAHMGWSSFERKIRRLGIRHIKKRSTRELSSRHAALIGMVWE